MPHYAFDIWRDIPFTSLSSTAKRLVVAWRVNRGESAATIPTLSAAERNRFLKICDEEGQEVLQDILLRVVELERENRLLKRRLRDAGRGV